MGIFGYPMVLKADGLAAGKGVVIAENEADAKKAIEEMMGDKVFGHAADKIVVEEFLTGVEASMLCFVDENTILPMESAQDYKRAFDDDKALTQAAWELILRAFSSTKKSKDEIRSQILEPTLAGFQKDGLDFQRRIVYRPYAFRGRRKVIEFNNRFGDPETQSVLARLESDLAEVFLAVTENRLAEVELKWKKEKAVCVVLASGGYPGSYEKGKLISGLGNVDPDVIVFHAGTKFAEMPEGSKCAACEDGCEMKQSAIVTSGGRVLGVTALGKTHEEARAKAYANAEKITFDGVQYRKDIGLIHRG